MDIGEPQRFVVVEPLEDPVPRERPVEREEEVEEVGDEPALAPA